MSPVVAPVHRRPRAPATAPTAATTGRDRDSVVDLVRAGALVVVVAWHWAFTTLRWDDGPRVGNPIGETPGLWLATWFLQVMPLFFLVGGSLHASSTAGGTWADDRAFVAGRLRRLVPPVVPLLGLAAVAAAGAAAVGRDDVVHGIVLMITPLWFLATYLVLVLLTPIARRVHGRWGLRAVVLGAALVAVVDRAMWSGHLDGVGPMLAEYVLTWAVVHQLGFHLSALRAASPRARWATGLAGLGLLALGVVLLGYPPSMVGTHTDPISNMSPPNLMVVFLALAQMGLLAVADPRLRRVTDRHRRSLRTAGAWSMTVYVWHMLALAAWWGVVAVTTGPVHHTVDGEWWSQRPLWLVGPLLFALPLFLSMGPRPSGPPDRSDGRAR